MIVERSAGGNAAEFAAEISHDSNAEKRMDVDTPPRTRPHRRMGMEGTIIHAQARV
jgi:hypothetical protein